MPQTIESLIKLAETDRDLQKYIFAKSHLKDRLIQHVQLLTNIKKQSNKKKMNLNY